MNTLSAKPMLFWSFADLAVEEFVNIYKKEIAKRFNKHELKRLTERQRLLEEFKFMVTLLS